MDSIHLHLILNHIPVLGAIFSLGLFAWAFVRRSEEIKRLALVVVLFTGASAGPVYLTGEESEDAFEKQSGKSSEQFLEAHEDAAKIALILALGTGALAAGILFFGLHKGEIPDWGARSTAVLTLVLVGSMAYTANLGGKAAHPEIRGATAGNSGAGILPVGSKDGKSKD